MTEKCWTRDVDNSLVSGQLGGPCWGVVKVAATIRTNWKSGKPFSSHAVYACEGHRLLYDQQVYVEQPAVLALAELADA